MEHTGIKNKLIIEFFSLIKYISYLYELLIVNLFSLLIKTFIKQNISKNIVTKIKNKLIV